MGRADGEAEEGFGGEEEADRSLDSLHSPSAERGPFLLLIAPFGAPKPGAPSGGGVSSLVVVLKVLTYVLKQCTPSSRESRVQSRES